MDYRLNAMEELLAWGRAGGDEDARFDMSQWALQATGEEDCGTVLCLAGKAASAAGFTFRWNELGEDDPGVYVAHSVQDVTGKNHTIRNVAARALGLSVHESAALFMADEPKKALDFLHHLIQRAKEGMGAMPHTEIAHWERRWHRQNSIPE